MHTIYILQPGHKKVERAQTENILRKQIFRIQAPDRHGSESEKEGMWLKIGEIGAVGGLLSCLPFGPGPGLGLVAALPPIWSDLTTDAGDKRIHHRRWEKFKGGQGGQGACGA